MVGLMIMAVWVGDVACDTFPFSESDCFSGTMGFYDGILVAMFIVPIAWIILWERRHRRRLY